MNYLKPTASRRTLQDTGHAVVREYLSRVDDILAAPQFLQLADCRHHTISRRQHVLNVSWYAFVLARKLRFDTTAVARSGLLHDLYYYNFRDEAVGKSEHIYAHPQLALANARRLTSLSAREEDIILNHMWPMCPTKTLHYKETYLVSCVDKFCCVIELVGSFGSFLKKRIAKGVSYVR